MIYGLVYWDAKLKKHFKTYSGTYDGARKQACAIIRATNTKYPVHITRAGSTDLLKNDLGEVWNQNVRIYDYVYVSSRAGEGIIWKINPKTGKLMSKAGYVD